MLNTPTKVKKYRLRRRLIRATASLINGLVHLRGGRSGAVALGLTRRPKPLLLASPNEAAKHNKTVGQLHTTRQSDSCTQRDSRTATHKQKEAG